MMHIRTKILFMLCLLMLFNIAAPVFSQDDIPPDVTPTPDLVVTQPPTTEGNTPLDWLQFAIDNQLHWYLFAFITVIFVGNLVPQSEMDKRREAARRTETPVDDAFWTLLDMVQSFKSAMQPAPQTVLNSPNAAPSIPIPRTPPFTTTPPPAKPINSNPTFLENVDSTEWYDGRAKDVPLGYTLAWETFSPDDPFGPPPEIQVTTDYGGMRIALAHRRGKLRIGQVIAGNSIKPGERYLLVIHGVTDLHLKPSETAILNWQGTISDDAVAHPLQTWAVTTTLGSFAAQWALEAQQPHNYIFYSLELEVGNEHNVPFDDFSYLTITDIELKPVPAGYGENIVLRF